MESAVRLRDVVKTTTNKMNSPKSLATNFTVLANHVEVPNENSTKYTGTKNARTKRKLEIKLTGSYDSNHKELLRHA